MNDKALNIKIPSALYDALKKEAEKKNISRVAGAVDMLRVF